MSKFIKGQSGNPGGRPREIGDLRIMARERTEEALATLAAVMLDKHAPPSARVAASTAILDRAYGRPTTIIEAAPPEKLLDVVEAARRIAFAINSAAIQGVELEGIFKELIPPALPALDAAPSTS